MKKVAALALASTAAVVLAASAAASNADNAPNAVYTLSNSAAGNAVLAFTRAADGSLTPAGSFATGGNGAGAALGSQAALVLSGKDLYAVNAGSNSLSVFEIEAGTPQLEATVASGGVRPISVAVSGKLVYVLNGGGAGSIAGFTRTKDGLAPIAGSTQPLAGTNPAQISFTPDGSQLVVTEKGTSTIDTYVVGKDGVASTPVSSPSSAGTPFGFDWDNHGRLLVSNASGSASSYSVGPAGATAISGAVATHQAAPCWLVATKNGRYAYTANAGAGTVSGFAIGVDGSLTLLDPSGASASLGAGSHPLDEVVSGDSRFLDVLVDGFHRIDTFRISGGGGLTPAGSTGGLPAGTVGLAAS